MMDNEVSKIDKIRASSVYLFCSYPSAKQHNLSKSRFTKLIYLSDWFMAYNKEITITDIPWEFNHYGPYFDIEKILTQDGLFEIRSSNYIVGKINLYKLNRSSNSQEFKDSDIISDFEKKCIDKSIELTVDRSYADFIDYIYRTPPMINAKYKSKLNLVQVAKKYQK